MPAFVPVPLIGPWDAAFLGMWVLFGIAIYVLRP